MTDAERIRALRDEGRIDDAQAERLLQALDDIAAATADDAGATTTPADAGATSTRPSGPPAADRATTPTATPTPTPSPTPPAPPEPTAAQAAAEPPEAGDATLATDTLADVTRWVRVDLLACALDVRVDPALDAPAADARRGEVRVEAAANGWRVVQEPREGASWLDRLVDGIQHTRLDLRLPPATGLELDVKAGDVDLAGVPALRGRLMAGDLEAEGLRAVDVSISAGDVEIDLDPAPGLHRVRLSVGDLDVRLPRGADVRVEGHVQVGDASAPAPFTTERRGLVAEHVGGVLGEGRATLRASVGTGDLSVDVRDHGR